MSNAFQTNLRTWLETSNGGWSASEREDDVTVRRTSTILPTARKVAKSSSETVTGTFAKWDHTVVEIESKLEYDYAEVLDADVRVRDFRTQADPLHYSHDGRRPKTFMDFDIDLVDDTKVYAAVKPKARQASSGIQRILKSVGEEHGAPGRRFVLIDEDHLADHQVRNARLTNRALREDKVEAAEADRLVLDHLQACEFPAQVADVQIALALHGRTLTSVARLIRRGVVTSIEGGELRLSSLVAARDAARGLAEQALILADGMHGKVHQ